MFWPFSKKPNPSAVQAQKALDTIKENTSDTTIQVPLPSPNLGIKKVDYYYSRWHKKWKYANTGSNIVPELRPAPESPGGTDDAWNVYCFVVIRNVPQEENREAYFKVQIKSPYLVKACKEVIDEMNGLSWTAVPLQVRSNGCGSDQL
jgi:hypothetical protein